MTKNRALVILGLLVAVIPLAGFPSHWEEYINVALGFVIVFVTLLIIRDRKKNRMERDMLAEERRKQGVNGGFFVESTIENFIASPVHAEPIKSQV